MRPVILFTLLLLLTVASLLFSLTSGSIVISWQELLAVISGTHSGNELTEQVLLELRWPRTVAAFTTGALLALAGGLMQVLLRNPLADPYVLGVSGGAATGALLAMLSGLGSFWMHGSAFGGALLSMLLVFGLSHGAGSWTTSRLLLTGIVIAAGWACWTFVLGDAGVPRLLSLRHQNRELERELARLDGQRERLQSEVRSLRKGDAAVIERIAREEHALVRDGEVLVRFFEAGEE